MSESKRSEVDRFVREKTSAAIAEILACMILPGPGLEWLKANRSYVAKMVADEVAEEYSFLRLADIMGWKRTRVRR